jgi:subtilisin-like proprotein convertase family protein
MKIVRKLIGTLLILSLVGLVIWIPADLTGTMQQMGQRSPDGNSLISAASNQTSPGLDHWVSEPVEPVFTLAARDLPPSEVLPTLDREINPRMNFGPVPDADFDPPSRPDPLLGLQVVEPEVLDIGFGTPIFNFDGQGYTFLNPPDTTGAVGKDHYIQMINATRVAIYDKITGNLVIPTFSLSALGGCATNWGDPIVMYDQLADRWFLSEFGSGNSLCTYVSQTPDPTGAYYSYQFSTPSFPDYPKYGVWPDAYYATTNESSPAVYALNRAAMLNGQPATAQRFTAPGLAGFGFEALTPADLDGMTPPPAGAPNYIMRHVDTEAHNVPGYPANDILEVWAFSVNWTTPGNSTFTKIADILTAEFDSTLCGLTSFYCMGMPGVPQGATNSLDPLREVIMHRLAYRNFGTHEALVGNFVTDIGDNIGGIRWFELRKSGAGAWALYQEGTYAPTTLDNRWMGAIAMDGFGNIAMGYNVSSQTIYPSLRYVGRLASDPLGSMPQGEYTLVNGSAVNGSNRYGDYSGMSIDPIDDCTFWFTGEWNDASQWKTRIGAFRFDACGEDSFSLNVAPESQQVCAANDAVYNVTLAAQGNFAGLVTLSTVDAPGTASFDPNQVTPPGISVLTVSGAPVGAYNFDVVGTSDDDPPIVQSRSVALEVIAEAPSTPALLTPALGTTDAPLQPTFTWEAVPGAVSYLIEVATDFDFTNVVDSAVLSDTSYTPGDALNPATLYFWRVTASNACGDSAPSATFLFVTQSVNLFCNATPISIPSSGAATPYPSNITVAGFGSTISDVNVHLYDMNHTWPDDIDILLVGPQGQNLIIMSDAGGSNDLINVDLVLDDAAANSLPDSTQIVSGSYKPTNYGTGDTFPAPAPAPSAETLLAIFNGTNPNGAWSLYVVDDAGGDLGNINGGWCLEITGESAGDAAITLTQTVGLDPDTYPLTDEITVPAGTEVTFFYRVENTGTVALPLHTLATSSFGTLLGPDHNYDLLPGESLTLTNSVVVTEPVSNTAIWLAATGGLDMAAASAAATVNVANLGISLSKTVGTEAGVCAASDAIEVAAGTQVYYCYTVENTGDEALALHDLVDDELGAIFLGLAYDLLPGASIDTVTAGLEISAIIDETVTNTAVWTAYNDETFSTAASAAATVTVVEPPLYRILLPLILK